MKTELHPTFEMGDDPEVTKFHKWAFWLTLSLSYCNAVAGAIGIIKFANWLLQ